MKYHIVSVGISKHKNSGANLEFADKDASEFFNLFSQNIGNIGYKRLLVNQEATLTDIKTALGETLKQNVQPDDAFFFFYSGHGALAADPEDHNSDTCFLVPYDATKDISNTGFSVENIKKIFEELPSKANFIFIDSCFSGSVSKNSKVYPYPKVKEYRPLKSFINTDLGEGSVIFTASKADEMSLEDPEYKNGLFTYYLLKELQIERKSGKFSVMEIHDPIAKNVGERAKNKWKHTQTPTFKGTIQGELKLPVFKENPPLTLERVEIPRIHDLQSVSFSVLDIDITEAERDKQLEETITFVLKSSRAGSFAERDPVFERFCYKAVGKIKLEWEALFEKLGGDIKKTSEAIQKMEAKSYHFAMLGATTVIYGNDIQKRIFFQSLISLLELTKDRAGIIALIAVPEVVVVEILYAIITICVARNEYSSLNMLIETRFDDPDDRDQPPVNILEYNQPHYTQALTGDSIKVNEHVREFLRKQNWLSELVPLLLGKTDEYQLQANFLLSMLSAHVSVRFWPDFARYDALRIMPFVRTLIYNQTVRGEVANLIGISENEVLPKFRSYISKMETQGLGKYWWNSISQEDLMTKEEREKRKSV